MPEILDVVVDWAFLAGMVSFLSPCVLPLVPGYVSYIAGHSLEELIGAPSAKVRLTVLMLSGCFVLGFSAVFIALGASATALSQFMQSYRAEADIIAGTVVVIFGLMLTGLVRIPFLNMELRFRTIGREGSALGALTLGSAFAFGWTPCIGPVLGAVLTLSAATETVGGGVMLLSVYSLGLAVPFLLVAAFTGGFVAKLRCLGGIGRRVQVLSGAILMFIGAAMAFGYLTMFGTWMLNALPLFQDILL